MSALLEVRNLSAEFLTRRGAFTALDDVSITVGDNEIVGIVGESGSGKSTAVRSIIRLLQPPGRVTGGQVLLEDRDLLTMDARALRRIRGEQIGFVAQSPFGALNPVLRLEKQFANVFRAHRRSTRSVVRDRARQLLASTGIPDPDRVLDGYAHQLSGGMAQRVALALALSLDPRLLIADEPTTALDLTVQRQVLDLMRDLVRGSQRSMLLVTHDLTVVASYCDRVVVMYGGRVVEAGDVPSVFASPQHPYTRALLDSVVDGSSPGFMRQAPRQLERPAAGCGYLSRCPRATDRCQQDRPPLDGQDTTNVVACHHPLTSEVVAHVASGHS